MDEALHREWYDWTPRHTQLNGDVTPETFGVSLWHLQNGQIELAAPQETTGVPFLEELNFQSAPELIRTAWSNSNEDSKHPQAQSQDPTFGFARLESAE